MKVRWSDGADRDRDNIVGHIWLDSPSAARRLDAVFDDATDRLSKFPRLGKEGAIPGTRELLPYPTYRLVYRIRDGEIIILALVHTARQWPPIAEDDA